MSLQKQVFKWEKGDVRPIAGNLSSLQAWRESAEHRDYYQPLKILANLPSIVWDHSSVYSVVLALRSKSKRLATCSRPAQAALEHAISKKRKKKPTHIKTNNNNNKKQPKPGIVMPTCSPVTWEVNAGEQEHQVILSCVVSVGQSKCRTQTASPCIRQLCFYNAEVHLELTVRPADGGPCVLQSEDGQVAVVEQASRCFHQGRSSVLLQMRVVYNFSN